MDDEKGCDEFFVCDFGTNLSSADLQRAKDYSVVGFGENQSTGFIRIGNEIFKGSFVEGIGTNLIFETRKKSPEGAEATLDELRYVGITKRTVECKRVSAVKEGD